MSRTPLALIAVALTLAAPVLVVPAPGAAAPPSRPAPRAHVWLTTPDGSEQLSDQGTVAFGETRSGGSDQLTITVDPSLRYQRIDGFGASITDSSASLLMDLSRRTRAATMRDLFADNRISFLRQPLGSSDFVDGEHYTFDDVPPGATDFDLSEFSIEPDRAEILPLVRRAIRLNPELRVMGTPWSPPAWMKQNDSLIGGRLKDDPRVYRAYARYLVKTVRAYADEGVPLYGLTIQNEPQNRNPDAYPGMDLPVRQAAAVIDELGPRLRRAGLDTKILGFDHNWELHPNDAATTPAGEDPEPDYPADLLGSSAGRWLAGTAYHCYFGDQKKMTALHQRFPRKGIWFTECSGSHGPSDPPEQVFRDTLTWHSRNLTLGTTRNWARTMVTWNLVLRPDGGPHNGGCGTCTGVVTAHPDGTVTRNAEYFTIGHLSRFVRPGARRVASSSYGSTGWNGLTMSAAFVNPDGSTALVVHNEHDDPRGVTVAVGDRAFDYTLPGGSLATFTWPASGELGTRGDLVDPWTTTVTASEGDAAVAADDDGSTAWRVDAQQAGQWLAVDLGSRQRARRVVLDAGPSSYGFESPGTPSTDAPASYVLQVSRRGRRWHDVRTGHADGQLTSLRVGDRRVRHVRVLLTEDAAKAWQVAEVRVYR